MELAVRTQVSEASDQSGPTRGATKQSRRKHRLATRNGNTQRRTDHRQALAPLALPSSSSRQGC